MSAGFADVLVAIDVMIPMRDGVKLYTVILVPNGALGKKTAPVLILPAGIAVYVQRGPNGVGLETDKNRWELCSRVLARKDVIEKLSESW